jgi:DoxX-like family
MQRTKIKTIVYWFTTGLLTLDLLAGGAVGLLRPAEVWSSLQHLGYPAYFASILGFWKLLGGVALLVPGVPVLKEWAYAGICFDLTSAAVSHAASGDGAAEVSAPLVIAVLAIASYVLRPCSRTIAAFDSESEANRQPEAVP